MPRSRLHEDVEGEGVVHAAMPGGEDVVQAAHCGPSRHCPDRHDTSYYIILFTSYYYGYYGK